MSNIIRCMHAGMLRGLQNDTLMPESVGVYYGFTGYQKNMAQLNILANTIKEEIPGITEKDMEVYEITTAQSNRHAHHTMIFVYAPTKLVRNNLGKYIAL